MSASDDIEVAPGVIIAGTDLEENFIRASGPGGQNVNKVATAVQLRFDAHNAAGIPDHVKPRLYRLAGQPVEPRLDVIGNAGRVMRVEAELDGGRHLVDVLPARPRGADEVLFEIGAGDDHAGGDLDVVRRAHGRLAGWCGEGMVRRLSPKGRAKTMGAAQAAPLGPSGAYSAATATRGAAPFTAASTCASYLEKLSTNMPTSRRACAS